MVSTPHATGYVTGSLPDDREVHYQAEKAKGGVGWQFMGATTVVRNQGYPWLRANVDDTIVPIYRRIAAAVHAHGGVIGAPTHPRRRDGRRQRARDTAPRTLPDRQ